MLELNKGKPILLLISILLLLIWFIYRWIYKKHKRWILAYYLRRLDMLSKHSKVIGDLLKRYPNQLTTILVDVAMFILIKQHKFISYRTTEIMNIDIEWRIKNGKRICSIKH